MRKETEKQPSDSFLAIIRERQLPIESSDAQAFLKKTLPHTPPAGFYERLARGLDYWDPNTFTKEIQQAATRAQSLLPPDYTLLVRNQNGSGLWIYKQMVQHGLHPAQRAFAQAYGKMDKSVPKGACVFAPDDWAIQGAQIVDLLLVANPLDYDVRPMVIRSTKKGEAFVRQFGKPTTFNTITYIKTISEALPDEDRQFLSVIDRIYNPTTREIEVFSPKSTSYSLAFSWYKVPDNFPTMLTGYPERGLPPLIRPERFLPPYRQVSTTI